MKPEEREFFHLGVCDGEQGSAWSELHLQLGNSFYLAGYVIGRTRQEFQQAGSNWSHVVFWMKVGHLARQFEFPSVWFNHVVPQEHLVDFNDGYGQGLQLRSASGRDCDEVITEGSST